MPTLKDIEEILNPADPSLTGLIPIGTTVAGGLINRNAVGNATENQVAGTQQGIDTVNAAGGAVKDIFDPYAQAGQGALTQLNAGLQPGGGLTDPFSYTQKDFENDPAYKFALDQGNKNAYAQAAARGLSLSGGAIRDISDYTTGLANQFYGQDYARAENTFNQNKAQRLKALQDLTGTGLEASQGQVQGQEWTATQISDLLGQKADAQAAGDVAGANAITQTLNGIAQTVTGNSALKKLYDIVRGDNGGLPQVGPGGTAPFTVGEPVHQAIQTGATAAGGGALSQIAGAGTIAEGIGTPSLIGQVGTTAAETVPGTAGGGVAGGFASVGHAVQSAASGAVNGLEAVGSYMLSNPWTIAVGAAIIAGTAIVKNMAHFEADDLTENIQGPFGENLGKVVNGFDQALASGQLDRTTAQQLRDSTAGLIDKFNQQLTDFAQKGSDQKKVVLQAFQQMADQFGARPDYPNLPSYDLILGKMDQEIAALPA